jgi:hypothetical protein
LGVRHSRLYSASPRFPKISEGFDKLLSRLPEQDPKKSGSVPAGSATVPELTIFYYFEGGILLPPDETGGQGLPVGDIPGVVEFAEPLPEVEGDDPEFDEAEFDEPEFDDAELGEPELDEPGVEDPAFGVEPSVAPGAAGNGPHGEPPGLVPGLLGLFGFTVEGCVLLPGVGGFGELEPGTVGGVLDVVELVGGFTGVVGGVVEPVGGVVAPGVCACPEVP